MIIKNIEGEYLYEDSERTIRRSLENAVAKGVPLPKANLRRSRLNDAFLDGLQAEGACLWGADLTGSDVADAFLAGADLRNTCLEDVCFAGTDLSGADFTGSFFKQTLLEQTLMDGALFNGDSLFGCDLSGVMRLERASYVCEDGHKIDFLRPPIVINGLSKRLVLLGGHILWGRKLYGPQTKNGRIPKEITNFITNFMPITQKPLTLRGGAAKGRLSGF